MPGANLRVQVWEQAKLVNGAPFASQIPSPHARCHYCRLG
jgi:hypothetical protein